MDIVERLRQFVYSLPSGKAEHPKICDDAADEITHLRDRVFQLEMEKPSRRDLEVGFPYTA